MSKQTSTSNDFLIQIDRFIAENRGIFRISPSRIISDFQGEEGLRKAYDGRQLLEMLQNADDAGAEKVLIHLDTNAHTLTFANTGVPFSAEGIGSLMIRDLSTKRGRKKMIGNKGLGFRSILNWSDKITIVSNGHNMTFSRVIAKREFLSIMCDEKKRIDLLTQHEYPEGMQFHSLFLAFPTLMKLNSRGRIGIRKSLLIIMMAWSRL